MLLGSIRNNIPRFVGNRLRDVLLQFWQGVDREADGGEDNKKDGYDGDDLKRGRFAKLE